MALEGQGGGRDGLAPVTLVSRAEAKPVPFPERLFPSFSRSLIGERSVLSALGLRIFQRQKSHKDFRNSRKWTCAFTSLKRKSHVEFPRPPYPGHTAVSLVRNTHIGPGVRGGGVCVRPLPPALAKALTLPTLVWGKQVTSVPRDQDVQEEAKMVQTSLKKLREENPLVLKDVSKVTSDVPQRQRIPKAKTILRVAL